MRVIEKLREIYGHKVQLEQTQEDYLRVLSEEAEACYVGLPMKEKSIMKRAKQFMTYAEKKGLGFIRK